LIDGNHEMAILRDRDSLLMCNPKSCGSRSSHTLRSGRRQALVGLAVFGGGHSTKQ
jgi:hypothetical protein